MIQGKDNILQERNPRGEKARWDPENKWEGRGDEYRHRQIYRFSGRKMGDALPDSFYFLNKIKGIIIREE